MNGNRTRHWINLAVGVWVCASAFLWSHSPAQFTNSWVVGALAAVVAAVALRVPQASFGNVLLSLWLFISAWALPLDVEATCWNNLLAAIVMFFAGLQPASDDRAPSWTHGL